MKALARAPAALAGGITAPRDCGGKDFLEFAVRDACNSRQQMGPTIRASGQVICMTGGHGSRSDLAAGILIASLSKAARRTGRDDLFTVGDALDADCYSGNINPIVCTEVQEPIERNLEVIGYWPPGQARIHKTMSLVGGRR